MLTSALLFAYFSIEEQFIEIVLLTSWRVSTLGYLFIDFIYLLKVSNSYLTTFLKTIFLKCTYLPKSMDIRKQRKKSIIQYLHTSNCVFVFHHCSNICLSVRKQLRFTLSLNINISICTPISNHCFNICLSNKVIS